MAAWWEIAIPVGGTLIGALTGAWAQGRNSVRLLRLQNAAAEQTNRDRNEHERAMRLLEEKRKQYVEFATVFDKWGRESTDYAGPANEWPEEQKHSVETMRENIFKLYTQLYFVASPEVLDVCERIYVMVAVMPSSSASWPTAEASCSPGG